MALWQSQMEDHTSDWLRAVPISGLGQTMNDRTYRCMLCYRLGVPLFSVTKLCSACSRVFMGDIYGDHAVSCAGIVGIKHRHNVVCDTLVDICYRSGIYSGKEVDIGLSGEGDKSLRPADVLLYVFLRKFARVVMCIGWTNGETTRFTVLVRYLSFVDWERIHGPLLVALLIAVERCFERHTLLRIKSIRIRKFSMAQDIGARAAVHIFNRISFSIAKGVGPR
ncbi:hypothetical protein Tco_0892098 [Tanacetum coccineum]|uniref:Uncharacterized protein n=1 Tax=Tanacetum coccineum TaxID=301880 RepID=A0ABQ5C4V6_9ASTR